MFYDLHNENNSLENYSVNPVFTEYNRMIYMALSEYFFDSGLYSYFKGGVFRMHIANDRVRTHRKNNFISRKRSLNKLVEIFSDAERLGDASQDHVLWSNHANGESFLNARFFSFVNEDR